MDRLLLHPKEAAERLCISPATVYSEIRAGRLRAVRAGRGWKVPVDALAEWVAQLEDNRPSFGRVAS